MALELPGPSSSDFFAESLLRIFRNCLGASLVNSIRFPNPFLTIHGWRVVIEFPGPIPLAFLGRIVSNMEDDPGAPFV